MLYAQGISWTKLKVRNSLPVEPMPWCLQVQIQPNKFPGDFQDIQSAIRIFALIEPLKCYNMGYKHMHFQLLTYLLLSHLSRMHFSVNCQEFISK